MRDKLKNLCVILWVICLGLLLLQNRINNRAQYSLLDEVDNFPLRLFYIVLGFSILTTAVYFGAYFIEWLRKK